MTNLITRTEGQVFHAVDLFRHALEEVDYAVGMTVVPGEVPGQFTPVVVIMLTRRETSNTTLSYSTNLSMDFYMSAETVDGIVSKALGEMRGGG